MVFETRAAMAARPSANFKTIVTSMQAGATRWTVASRRYLAARADPSKSVRGGEIPGGQRLLSGA
jgi:hypothetical protein